MTVEKTKPRTRIQKQNIAAILDAALEVFSVNGFRGSTLDQIANTAGISKPNLLYYFSGKEAIHIALLSELLDVWLAPLRELNPNGDANMELMAYVRRKLELSRNFPRESRLFANEIVQGAPRIEGFLQNDLKKLVDEQAKIISAWMDDGELARLDPYHLIFSIWAITQHYADFDAQIRMVRKDQIIDSHDGAEEFVESVFRKILAP
jgi:TetR/AcrR family transcriptional regulator